MKRISMPVALFILFISCRAWGSPYVTKVTMHQSGKIIYIEASVEKKKGFFVIDTGFRGILLNKRYFNGRESDRVLIGVTGPGNQFLETKRVDIHIGSLRERNLFAEIGDLDHLHRRLGMPILGLIGSTFFNSFEVVLDYERLEMTLYRIDKKGHRLELGWDDPPPNQMVNFRFTGHLPIIEVLVGQKKLRLGLDSGAECNLFDLKTMKTIHPFLRNHRTTKVTGLAGKVQTVPVAMLIAFEIGPLSYKPMRTIFADLKAFRQRLSNGNLDGILGYGFLHQFKIGINLKQKKLFLWEKGPEEKKQPELVIKNIQSKQPRLQFRPKM